MATRRQFLKLCAGAAASGPAFSQAGPQVRLGIDTYSIRDLRWKAIQLLDYGASLKVDALQIGQSDFESLDEAYLAKVREHARRLGITVEPAFGCICPLSQGWNPKRSDDPKTYLSEAIRVARTLGSSSVRVFMAGAPDRQAAASIPAMIENTVQSLRAVRSQAVDAGIKIAVENHGDLQAREAKALIEAAGKGFVACCLDSGNPVSVIEDPLYTLEVLAPYAVSTHIRDSVVYEHPRGAAVQWVALGDGVVDMRLFVRRFRELCPKAPFLLEIITGRPPQVHSYLEPDFWKRFPDASAPEFARFVALAKKGQPFAGRMVIGGGASQPPEFAEALKAQQRYDLERSLEYAKKTLDVGVAWRA